MIATLALLVALTAGAKMSTVEGSVCRIISYGGIPKIVWDEKMDKIIFKQDNVQMGTGFVISSSDSSSLILTDAHVLYFYAPSGRPIQAKRVVCWFKEGNIRVEGKVLKMDSFLDLALLEFPVPNLSSLELSSREIEETDIDALGTAAWLVAWPGQKNEIIVRRAVGHDTIEYHTTFFSSEVARFSIGDTLAVSKGCSLKILLLERGDEFVNLTGTAILDTTVILPLSPEIFLGKKIRVFDRMRLTTEEGIIKEELVYYLSIKDRYQFMPGTSGGPLLDADGRVVGIQQRDFLSVDDYHFLARACGVMTIRGFLKEFIE